MACVKIRFSEADNLPHVCVYCGKPASMEKSKKYSKRPSWVSIFFFIGLFLWLFALLWVVLLFLAGTSKTLMMPVCDRHANCGKWSMRIFLTGLAVFAIGVMAGVLLHETNKNLAENILIGGTLAFILAGLFAAFTADSQISALAIDDRSVTLKGVSKEFAAACRAEPVQLVAVGGKSRTSGGGIELTTAKYMKR